MAKKSKKPNQTLKIPKIILLTGKFLSFISTNLVVQFAARLFTTPIKYKIPKRELEMDAKSRQETIRVPSINKNIVVYHFGESSRKILLVHGWSGRGTQLVKFAEELVKLNYSTISFDAPAHGKSPSNTTLMPEFIASILEIDKQFGPFEAAVGHSLGGMSLLNAVKSGLKLNRLAIIGSGDIVQDIINDFVRKLELDPKLNDLLRIHFENKHNVSMDSFSSYHAAKTTDIPVLVIHDEDDDEVPVSCAHHIHQNLKNGELMITQNLGHRKILGDAKVIQKTINFITS
ncbi:alpha/beta hydrolase [Flavobacterium sp.]|uniref:alpha/beta fold hydrolase n=1 Tax=Flavobacterium sp. TaxID=239 RepID=UPI00286AF721|nr:alpha/beta hydrolase [Flavobacterium sp.]